MTVRDSVCEDQRITADLVASKIDKPEAEAIQRHRSSQERRMVSFVDALYSRYADPTYAECNSCELFIIGSLSPGKSGE